MSNNSSGESNRGNAENVDRQNESSQNGITISKAGEILGILAAAITVTSVIMSAIYTYISSGRCFYFDFDLDYYDFSLSNTSKLVFILALITSTISCVMAFFSYISWNKGSKVLNGVNNKKVRVILKIGAVIILILIDIVGLYCFLEYFIPNKEIISMCFVIMILMLFEIIILLFSIGKEIPLKKAIIGIIICIIAFVIIYAGPLMRDEYKSAENQKEFLIITEEVNSESNDYVVISEGKTQYSAYLCVLEYEENTSILKIIIDQHKYFDIDSVETMNKVKVDKVSRHEKIALSIDDFKQWKEHEKDRKN